MSGAHTTRTTRIPVETPRGGPRRIPTGPVPRSTRRAHLTGTGWWNPPKRSRQGSGAEDSARHRITDATDLIPAVTDPPPSGGSDRRTGRAPKPGRTPKPGRRRRIVLRMLIGTAAAAVVVPALAFVIGYLIFPVPGTDDAVKSQVSLVSYADGSQLTRLVPDQGNRIKVSIDAVPVPVRHAVLAAEDRTFYSNPGFDVVGILRAVWNQLRGGDGGGSTITQQFVKKTLVGDEQTLWRKYKELVLAVKISQERSKDQILGDYLNAIYFGRGAYGIQAAAQAYFGKNVQDLDAAEGALLAGVIQSPSRWDPAVDPEKAVDRWTFVLNGMVEQGWLDPAARAAATFPTTVARKAVAGGVPTDSRGHIVAAVTAELEELGITEQDVTQEGLRITTTIDPKQQQEAVDAAHDTLDGQPVNLRNAMVAINPGTGGVLAYYGGDNGLGLDYARTRRLAGSTFKPFVVLAALQQDPPVGIGEVFDGNPVPGLRNAEGAECPRCNLKQAMTVSNNVVFNSLAKQVGPVNVAAAAHSAGITSPLDDPNEGIALGNKEVSTFELASAYATLAAGGVWHQPHLVQSVVTADNRVLYDAATNGEQRFPERVARNVTEAMLDVADHDGLALPGGRPVAAKTGTVQSRFEGQNNDAWMAGFTPNVAAAVWMGTDMNSPIRTAAGRPIEGASLPGEVWKHFMVAVTAPEPIEQFPPFRAIGQAPVEEVPNRLPADPPSPAPGTPAPGAPPLPGQPPNGQPPNGQGTVAQHPVGQPPGAAPAVPPADQAAGAAPAPAQPDAFPARGPVGARPQPQPEPLPQSQPQPVCTLEHPCG
ncbi:transglycosylase domain-containing protein [Pseudonocardia sp. GCM10023141]|uniref:transglycosylase domain-containing protein n=1 Tax=Pseudonocardia sp. GCM10023141 TaxID=3252653 RepID=UPI003610704C